MQQINPDVDDVVSKRTKIAIFATHHRIQGISGRIGSAELGLVFVRMVELLHSVVSVRAVIAIRTFLTSSDNLTQLSRIEMRESSSIFIAVVVVDTSLGVVSIRGRTWPYFEGSQVKMSDKILIIAWVENSRIINSIW